MFSHVLPTALVLAIGVLTVVVASPQLSMCIIQCVNSAASDVDCTFMEDDACLCNNPVFVNDTEQCLLSACTPAEQDEAVSYMNSACHVGSSSGAVSFPPITAAVITTTSMSATTTNSPQSPSHTTTTTSSSKPGAAVSRTHAGLEGVVGAAVLLATVVGLALVHY